MAESKSVRPLFADQYVNLASPQLGGAICHVSDEFFAPAKRMLSEETPVFVPDRFALDSLVGVVLGHRTLQ